MESPCRTPAAVSRPSGAQNRREPSNGCRAVASRVIKCWECQRPSCGPATVYVGLITSKHHRDQLQGAPLSLSPHERASKDPQSREKPAASNTEPLPARNTSRASGAASAAFSKPSCQQSALTTSGTLSSGPCAIAASQRYKPCRWATPARQLPG